MKNTASNTIPAVEKATAVVTLLGNSAHPLSTKEIDRRLSISPSTCYRVLQTLVNAQWVEKTNDGRYRLAGGLLPAVRSLIDDVKPFEAMQPALDLLSEETGLSSKLSIRRGDVQLTVLRAESGRQIQVSGKIGAEFPIVEGSVGAALLAEATDEDLRELAARCREDIDEKKNPGIIIGNVRKLREAGYVCNDKANRWKVLAMSAPVRDDSGRVVAALTLLGWNDDFAPANKEALAEKLMLYASLCAKMLRRLG